MSDDTCAQCGYPQSEHRPRCPGGDNDDRFEKR